MNEDIWIPESGKKSTFNDHFLIYYILYNSEKKLKLTLNNLLKNMKPLPMYLRKNKGINHVENHWMLNEELLWILNPSVNVMSVGFHSEHPQKENGKSTLNNILLFTNFTKSG